MSAVNVIPACVADTYRQRARIQWIKTVLLGGGHLDTDIRYRLCTEDAGRWYGR